MVTILPKEEGWDNVFKEIGKGASEGYQNRSDEMALQRAVGGLGDRPSPRQILDAITKTNTYSPAAKQNALKNYMGVVEFEEVQRHAKATEEEAGLKSKLKATEDKLEKQRDADDALLAIDNSDLPPEKKQVLSDEVKSGRASYNAIKDIVKPKKPNVSDNAKKESDKNDALLLINSAKIPDEEKKALRTQVENGKASYDAIKEVLKPNNQDIKNKEEEKSQSVTQKAFNDIVSLIPDVGRSGIITSKLGGDTAKAYSQFTSLTGALEALLVEKVNRGALSNTRFKYIVETLLPKPSDSQADITGKLEGLATILELDPSALKGKALQSKGNSPEGKIRVRNKQTGKTGHVTPFEGMESKYDRI